MERRRAGAAPGQNRLSANGKIAKTITLAANIDFPALSTLMPDVAGELKGKIDATGTLDKPRLASNFTGRRLQIGENRISDMALSAGSMPASVVWMTRHWISPSTPTAFGLADSRSRRSR
ncbi:hypothetical protein ACU8V3_01120 [Cobetia marina]